MRPAPVGGQHFEAASGGRVWDFSARFIDLCEEMQDHIIKRAIGGEA